MRCLLLVTILLCYCGHATSALIGSALADGDDIGLVHYHNELSTAFTSSQDAFQIIALDSALIGPEQLWDRSAEAGKTDTLGLIDTSGAVRGRVFAVSDTVNSDTSSGALTASWTFSVAGFRALELGLDIAAMGDFEHSDQFTFRYAFDDEDMRPLWQSSVDVSSMQEYELASGVRINLDDPLMMANERVSNEFRHFSHNFTDLGSELTIALTAKTDGGSEVFAFNNLKIQGERTVAAPVPEPNGLLTLVIAIGLCSMRCRV